MRAASHNKGSAIESAEYHTDAQYLVTMLSRHWGNEGKVQCCFTEGLLCRKRINVVKASKILLALSLLLYLRTSQHVLLPRR